MAVHQSIMPKRSFVLFAGWILVAAMLGLGFAELQSMWLRAIAALAAAVLLAVFQLFMTRRMDRLDEFQQVLVWRYFSAGFVFALVWVLAMLAWMTLTDPNGTDVKRVAIHLFMAPSLCATWATGMIRREERLALAGAEEA